MNATKVNAGPAESSRLLPGIWRDSLHVTCGLTACTPGSAPGPTLGNEYGKTLPFYMRWYNAGFATALWWSYLREFRVVILDWFAVIRGVCATYLNSCRICSKKSNMQIHQAWFLFSLSTLPVQITIIHSGNYFKFCQEKQNVNNQRIINSALG